MKLDYWVNERRSRFPWRLVTMTVLAAFLIGGYVVSLVELDSDAFSHRRTSYAPEPGAKAEMSNLSTALQMYQLDCGSYPTTAQGLQALLVRPASVQGWTGPYWDMIRNDPWGHAYVYHFPSLSNNPSQDFDLFSCGPDGKPGTADDIRSN